eukprot:2321623-Prorocentrum_lima.AAC.1
MCLRPALPRATILTQIRAWRFSGVQQRTAVQMPFVYEEDSTVFADAAGRVQRRHPPLAGQ